MGAGSSQTRCRHHHRSRRPRRQRRRARYRSGLRGWRILAAEDSETRPDTAGEVIAIDGGALATLSTRVRRWQAADGVELHHLIDPRTGRPVSGPWRTATVVADRCVDANTAATAAIVLGAAAVPWLESTGLPARLIDSSGDVTRVGRWPARRISHV